MSNIIWNNSVQQDGLLSLRGRVKKMAERTRRKKAIVSKSP